MSDEKMADTLHPVASAESSPPSKDTTSNSIVSDTNESSGRSSKFKEIWIPLLATIITLVGILSGAILHVFDSYRQEKLKQYEVTFQAKRELYASFIRHLSESFYTAREKDRSELNKSLDRLETDYYGMEPFLSENVRSEIWNEIQDFIQFCNKAHEDNVNASYDVEIQTKKFVSYKHRIRYQLYSNIFK